MKAVFNLACLCLAVLMLSCQDLQSQDRNDASDSDGLNVRTVHHSAIPTAIVPNGLGVNIHFTDPKPGELEMLAEGGFRWIRTDFNWGGTERTKGVYDFAAYERLLDALDKHKLRAVFMLGYTNIHYENLRSVTTEEGRQAFAQWAAAAVSKFQGRGIIWEIWNEPNSNSFWQPQANVSEYAVLAISAAKAIREVAPNETLIGPALSAIDTAFLEDCCKLGLLEYWDAVSLHPYRPNEPETVAADYLKIRELIRKYAPEKKNIPVLSGEWGYSDIWKHFNADVQGQMLARQWLTNLSNQIPLSIWYDWHDDGVDIKNFEHHFGTVEFQYHEGRTPVYNAKPAYLAAKALTSTFAGFHFLKRIAIGTEQDFAILFGNGHELRLAAWTTADPHELRIPSVSCSCDVIDHIGKSSPQLTENNGAIVVKVKQSPQYLIFNAPNPILEKTPVAHPMSVSCLQCGTALVVRILNLSADGFRGKASINEQKGFEPSIKGLPFELPPGDSEVSLRFPLDGRPRDFYRFGIKIENESGAPVLTVPTEVFANIPNKAVAASIVQASGDKNVPSEHSLANVQAPKPPPCRDAPVTRLTYRFGSGVKSVGMVPQGAEIRKIPKVPKAFGLWIYGDGQNTLARLRVVDSSRQIWQPSGHAINWTGWQFVRFELKPDTEHWGGPNDGVMHPPLSWESIFVIDNVSKKAVEGEVYLTSPVLIY